MYNTTAATTAKTDTMLKHFRKPSAQELAQRELDEARRQLLEAQAAAEYAAAMVDYNKARIARLSAFVQEGGAQ